MSDLKLISISDQDVAWVENDQGEIFGIVNAFKILDEDGIQYQDQSVYTMFDCDQCFESEANILNFCFENGESCQLIVTAIGIELKAN